MKDILLTKDGDLYISETGDIILTDSVRQAVRIRLLWFFKEWRLAPKYGVPYYDSILVKNPNLEHVRNIIRSEVRSVEEVIDARNIKIDVNKLSRTAKITLEIVTPEETYRDEVKVVI